MHFIRMHLSSMCSGVLLGQSRKFFTIPVTNNYLRSIPVCRQNSLCIQRLLSSETNSPPNASKSTSAKLGPAENFITVYKFPDIKYVSLINRGNRVYSNALPLVLAISYGISALGVTSITASIAVTIIGVILKLHIYLLARLSQNMVGFVYASQDVETVQIAFVDSMGRRKDEIFSSSDIIPFSETSPSVTDRFYVKLLRYSNPTTEILKMDLKRGEILDKDRFKKIFGTLDPTKT